MCQLAILKWGNRMWWLDLPPVSLWSQCQLWRWTCRWTNYLCTGKADWSCPLLSPLQVDKAQCTLLKTKECQGLKQSQIPENPFVTHWYGGLPEQEHYCHKTHRVRSLVGWCYEPSQPQRITSGLNTIFTLSPSYSFRKSANHKSCFFEPINFTFHGHSTREPASSRVTYFILRAYTGTSVNHSQSRKKSGQVLEKMQVNGLEG